MLKTTLFKWIVVIGSVSVLMVAGAMSYRFILLPRAPVINSFALDGICSPLLAFTDKATNESGFLVSFRPQGATKFSLAKVLPAQAGKGTTVNVALPAVQFPNGSYEIKVAAYNSYGQMSDLQTVVISSCTDIPPLPPGDQIGYLVEPLIVSAQVVNQCDVQINFVDFNENPPLEEDGLHIHRLENGVNGKIIADLPPAGVSTFVDTAPLFGNYKYMVSAYKGTEEVYSAESVMVNIAVICLDKMIVTFTPVTPNTPTPTLDSIIITPKKLSCEWGAAADVFLRKGPDVGLFDRLIDVQKGKTYPIVGQSEDGQFWAVEVEPGLIGYITKSEKYSRVTGDCGDVSTLTDPEPPEVIPAATKKPGEPAGPAACADGVDNDGDGLVDYNPFGSGDPGCSSSEGTSE